MCGLTTYRRSRVNQKIASEKRYTGNRDGPLSVLISGCHLLTETSVDDMNDTIFDDHWEEADMAAFRGISIQGLRNERSRRKGPPFVRLGNTIKYPKAKFKKWLEDREVDPAKLREAV
jgi:hypothetical protein